MAELKLYKSFDEKKSDDRTKSEFGQGTISFVSWDRLKPYIEHAVDKKPGEEVAGIKIDSKGIHVRFESKKH